MVGLKICKNKGTGEQKRPKHSVVSANERTRKLGRMVRGRRPRYKKPVVGGSVTRHPRANAWGTTTREGHASDDAWEFGFWSSCLRWIDQALTISMVSSSTGNKFTEKVIGGVRRRREASDIGKGFWIASQ